MHVVRRPAAAIPTAGAAPPYMYTLHAVGREGQLARGDGDVRQRCRLVEVELGERRHRTGTRRLAVVHKGALVHRGGLVDIEVAAQSRRCIDEARLDPQRRELALRQ